MARMSDRDAAFLWETEALRESTRRGDVADRPAAAPPTQPNWATLREAHYLTGIPIETLRKWARRGSVPSFLDESEVGVWRMVRMDAGRSRAKDLGRPISPIGRPPASRAKVTIAYEGEPRNMGITYRLPALSPYPCYLGL